VTAYLLQQIQPISFAAADRVAVFSQISTSWLAFAAVCCIDRTSTAVLNDMHLGPLRLVHHTQIFQRLVRSAYTESELRSFIPETGF
jgi:hypothetical protein